MKCPNCHKNVDDTYTVQTSNKEPFTAVAPDALNALSAWGGYDVPRTVICQTDDFVHFAFNHDGHEHLVKMVIYDPDAIGKAWELNEQKLETCEHDGCDEQGAPTYFYPTDTDPAGYYCNEHMHEEGFCPGCRLFNAGFESFDFSPTGYCGSCAEMLRDEMGDYDEYEYEDDWDDYP